MKRLATLLLVGALVALIVHPVVSVVNVPVSNDGPRADGATPAPPWPTGGGGLLVADGATPAPPWPTGGGESA